MKLAELQRDLGGYEHLLQPEREFLREGCLQKLSRKGYQQRMFFLVSIFLNILPVSKFEDRIGLEKFVCFAYQYTAVDCAFHYRSSDL